MNAMQGTRGPNEGRCPQCQGNTVSVTLGGFLTIERCDICELWRGGSLASWQRVWSPAAALSAGEQEATNG